MLGVIIVDGRIELVIFSETGIAYRVAEDHLKDPSLLVREPLNTVEKIEKSGLGDPLGFIDD